MTGLTYNDFEIANDSEVQLSYLYLTHRNHKGEKASPVETKKIRADLVKYCAQDTEGMIKILDKLEEIAR